MKNLLRVLLLVNVTLLQGCIIWVEDKQDLQRFVAKTKATPSGKIEPLPEFKPYHSFVYEGASMREPFVPLVAIADDIDVDGSASDFSPDNEREKEYLEQFSLDDLAMVGIINQKKENQLWALIKDTRSEIHRVQVGDYMGLDHGQVISLDEEGMQLVEIVTNGRGGWMKRSRSLSLAVPE